METVKFRKLNDKAITPSYGSAAAAGADLYACTGGEAVKFAPGETRMIHTGIAMQIPYGLVGLVYARSGIATKRGLAPANKVGVIDSDYRGEIFIGLHNISSKTYEITPNQRIAQLIIMPILYTGITETDHLNETERGQGGFGSTGK